MRPEIIRERRGNYEKGRAAGLPVKSELDMIEETTLEVSVQNIIEKIKDQHHGHGPFNR